MNYCQLCDAFYDRRFYRIIECGLGLHPNLKIKIDCKTADIHTLIALWTRNPSIDKESILSKVIQT